MSFDVIFLSGRTHSDVPGAFKEMVEWLQKLEGGIDHYQHIAHSYILWFICIFDIFTSHYFSVFFRYILTNIEKIELL